MFALSAAGAGGARRKILAETSTALSVIANMFTLHAAGAGSSGRIILTNTVAALATLADMLALSTAGAGRARREILTNSRTALPVVTEVLALHAAGASRTRWQISKGPCGYQSHSGKYEGFHCVSSGSRVGTPVFINSNDRGPQLKKRSHSQTERRMARL